MGIVFVTSNKHKLADLKTFIPGLEQLEMDLPEIQSLDPEEVVRAKLLAASAAHDGELIVDDVSVKLAGLNGLPGPLIKFFVTRIGAKGIADLVGKLGSDAAEAICTIGYCKDGEIHIFQGTISGTIVQPRGDSAFGWDPVFLPDGETRTFAEMSHEEKNADSHRARAMKAFVEFYESRDL